MVRVLFASFTLPQGLGVLCDTPGIPAAGRLIIDILAYWHISTLAFLYFCQMFTVVTGTILLAIVHALIPNHWLPLVAVARAEKWSRNEMTMITFLAVEK